jgi:hypothetical protein
VTAVDVPTVGTPGAVLFARYAYPPNALGYCGPADAEALRQCAALGVDHAELHALARRFEGAWPYLSLIAAATGRPDPLDASVVQSYWIGGPLLERVPRELLAANLDERFARRAGRRWTDLRTLAMLGGRAHHNFHVLAVYPWVGMLRAGYAEEPLRVLNSCRVRWGTVLDVDGVGGATVRARPLCWDGRGLSLGVPTDERVRVDPDRHVRPGDTVTLHWDWLCDVLNPARLTYLRHYTSTQLTLVNRALDRPVVADLLD